MKQKLLIGVGLMCLYMVSTVSVAQSISTPAISIAGQTVSVSFEVTNGNAPGTYFSSATAFTINLSQPDGTGLVPAATFYSANVPAPLPLAGSTIVQTFAIPSGTLPGSQYVASVSVGDSLNVASGTSQPFALAASFSIPAQLNGAIKCQSPAITYYTLTITNTGLVPDVYGLTKAQTLYPLGSSFLSLTGSPISHTPQLDPGESYTFMMLFETPNGTPPDNWNTTVVTATSVLTGATHQTNILTYIYCGNNNSNLPNAPDMEIVKTASTAFASVGDFIDYTITIRNLTTKNAQNPVIKDFIPANADLISYHKNPADPRNVVFTHNAANGTLSALVQSTMTSASMPLTIYLRVVTTCESVPGVTNSAEVFTSSGDTNSNNDVSAAFTAMNFSLQSAQVGLWTGNFSSDWFDCRNWSGGIVPNNNTSVVIPSGSPLCEISGTSAKAPVDLTARCFDIRIEGSAQLAMSNAGIIAVAGNWQSNANFSPGNGTVNFMGWQPQYQQIADSSSLVEFHNLVISSQGKGLSVPDAFGIKVHNALSLTSGDIRLNGKSQLIQTADGASVNPLSGSGKLLVDQQGQSNFFSYNYWSSPVGTGNSYTVGDVLHDGTDPENPLPVTWVSGYDGSPTTPISLSPYWINKYQNASGSYASWSCILQTGELLAGQGYTMKGSGTSASQQNYTFIGKPNNGLFTGTVSANNMNLSGNPYPCALDAHAFIDDNLATTTGTLYFWEQFSTNSSHITANYEGGYATVNKTGATPPVAPAGISSAGSSNRTPGRYIPLGQGFLLFGSETGGTITFRNTQRDFVLDSDTLSNPMFRSNADVSLRLNFTSSAGNTKRELLLAFMADEASDGFDPGYDAPQIDTKHTDVFFPVDDKNLVIQARGEFNQAPVPLTVLVGKAGAHQFSVSDVQGVGVSIGLHDSFTGAVHDLSAGASIFLPAGKYVDRFSIRFGEKFNVKAGRKSVPMAFASEGMLHISNADQVKRITLYDLNGSIAGNWKVNQKGDVSLELPSLETGTYIARISGPDELAVKIQIQ